VNEDDPAIIERVAKLEADVKWIVKDVMWLKKISTFEILLLIVNFISILILIVKGVVS